ncbi:MAG: hypothetical protein Q8S54_07090 [Bacteroidota bacterium]|nr:hypothetical protein [Bacteroidota bacterium]
MKKALIFILFLQLSALTALAQGNREINQTIYSNNYSLTISPTIVLTSTSTLSLPSFASTSDLENGLESSAIHLVVQSNMNWKLTTEIGAITAAPNADSPALINSPLTFANFTFATTSVDDANFGTFNPFNINFQAVTKTGILGDATVTGNTFNLKLKIIPGYEVDPANYTIPFIMTLSGQ